MPANVRPERAPVEGAPPRRDAALHQQALLLERHQGEADRRGLSLRGQGAVKEWIRTNELHHLQALRTSLSAVWKRNFATRFFEIYKPIKLIF